MTGGKQRMPGRAVSALLSVALAAFVMPIDARAGYIDQESPLNPIHHYLAVVPTTSGAYGQEFVPTVAEHLAIELGLKLQYLGSFDPVHVGILDQPIHVSLRIREATITGSIVEGSEVTRALSNEDFTEPWVHFAFEQPIVLNAGQTYVIELLRNTSVGWLLGAVELSHLGASPEPSALQSPYSGGNAIADGHSLSSLDFTFRTIVATDPVGQVVPEPMTMTMLLAGLALRRRRFPGVN